MMGMGMGVGLGIGMGPGMMGMGMPFGPMFGGGVHSAGPLALPRDPWNTPGLMGNPSSRYGSAVPGMPGLGFAAAEMPPPPPGIAMDMVPPFAPGVPAWATGGAVPGMGAGVGMMGMGSMGMGMNPMYGFGGLFGTVDRSAPAMITEASALSQPSQGDITQIPGGIPPGATHVESGEHTVVHVLKGPIYPWLNHGMPMEVEILHMSSVTGVNRIIEILNNNQPADGMAVSECHEMVNGVWEKGQTFVWGDAVSRVLTLKDAGWDNTRNRTGGQSLHVYLHRV
jgi:hypothetical protein